MQFKRHFQFAGTYFCKMGGQGFGLLPDECMAFGDNFNDIQMLESVTHSYAMQNAVDEIKTHAAYVTDSVEKVLREFL